MPMTMKEAREACHKLGIQPGRSIAECEARIAAHRYATDPDNFVGTARTPDGGLIVQGPKPAAVNQFEVSWSEAQTMPHLDTPDRAWFTLRPARNRAEVAAANKPKASIPGGLRRRMA